MAERQIKLNPILAQFSSDSIHNYNLLKKAVKKFPNAAQYIEAMKLAVKSAEVLPKFLGFALLELAILDLGIGPVVNNYVMHSPDFISGNTYVGLGLFASGFYLHFSDIRNHTNRFLTRKFMRENIVNKPGLINKFSQLGNRIAGHNLIPKYIFQKLI